MYKSLVKVLWLMVGVFNILSSNVYKHTFEIEEGQVFYNISGGGVLTNETNLSLNGKAILHFTEWGATLLAKDEGIVKTIGALKSKQIIQHIEKQTKNSLYTVDFKHQTIQERKHSISLALKEKNIDGLTYTGVDSVIGIRCEVWEGYGIRKCIYKGLPLSIESEVLGISYHKVATSISFNLDKVSKKCELPHFPKEKFALITSTTKTDNSTQAKCFTDMLKDVAIHIEKSRFLRGNEINISRVQKEIFLNKIGQKIFQSQQKILPLLLESMKKTRECLQVVNNPFEANQCISHFSRLKEQLGSSESNFIILWDKKEKSKLLVEIEKSIMTLGARMPCIKRARNITDLSACMK